VLEPGTAARRVPFPWHHEHSCWKRRCSHDWIL